MSEAADLPQLQRAGPCPHPVRILQFGQGNFLRGFLDRLIDELNERCGLDAGVLIVRPTLRSQAPLLDEQGGLYTTVVRGLDADGQLQQQCCVIRCVHRELDLRTMVPEFLASARLASIEWVVSNTTEAGIALEPGDRYEDLPPRSFPAKLTRWLHERWLHFGGTPASGVTVLPLELIDDNGPALLGCVLEQAATWQLPGAFLAWVGSACAFHSTLVDCIVPGHPGAEAEALERQCGHRDRFMVAAEDYHQWLIQAPPALAQRLRLAGSGLSIHCVDDIAPYKRRKVGILNGAHTVLVPVALLAGLHTVDDAMRAPRVRRFLEAALADEILPALGLPLAELEPFAAQTLRRFANPTIRHRLQAIALNSWPKFAARVMPQILAFRRLRGEVPRRLVLAMAATMLLYRGRVIPLADDPATLAWFQQAWQALDSAPAAHAYAQMARAWLAHQAVWGADLSLHADLVAQLAADLQRVDSLGIEALDL